METIKIALLGLGNVGMGVYKILNNNSDKISKSIGKKLEIKKILVKDLNKNRETEVPKDILTDSFVEILNDDEISIVAELIGGIKPVKEYIEELLKSKKHVVTANKAVVAQFGEELTETANDNKVSLKYEGSVAGGIPIINTLMNSLSCNEFEEIIGIINGTTNYILTQMTENNLDFETALKQAQEKGYAEADPTSDIEGEDAAFKLSILTSVAYGFRIHPNDIPREGVTRISDMDIQYASQLGYRIKLLATVKKLEDQLELYVYPALISKNHPLASVSNEFNALFVKGKSVGELMFYGKGAGSLPTGSAVLGDIMEIGKHIGNELLDTNINGNKVNTFGIGKSQYFIRLQVKDVPGVLGNIAMTFGENGVSLDSVVQRGRDEKTVPLVFITHEVDKKQLDLSLKQIYEIEEVKEIASILKVENLDQ